MTGTKKRDGHIDRRIEKLLLSKAFQADVKELRGKALIPENGFDTFEQYFSYLEDEIRNRRGNFIGMYLGLSHYTRKYNLPLHFLYWIEALVALGRNYKNFKNKRPDRFQTEFDILGLNEAVRILDDRIELHIFPGAGQRSIIDFIESNWREINRALKVAGKEYGMPTTPRNRQRKDHTEIYKLHKSGLIDYTGTWKGDPFDRPECLKIGTDRIKQIILAEAKKDKFR